MLNYLLVVLVLISGGAVILSVALDAPRCQPRSPSIHIGSMLVAGC